MEKVIKVDEDRFDEMLHIRRTNMSKLAEQMDMHYNGVKRIRTKGTTSFDGLTKLCIALNCHPFDLLATEGFPEPFLDALVSH